MAVMVVEAAGTGQARHTTGAALADRMKGTAAEVVVDS